CSNTLSGTDNKKDAAAQPSGISVQSFELIDLNGKDIYPGEELAAVIRVINAGQQIAENISLELLVPEILLLQSSTQITQPLKSDLPGIENTDISIYGNNAQISQLAPGQEVTVEIPLKVIGQLNQDITSKVSLALNKNNPGAAIIDETFFTVFGVAPYERDEIPIIGLHAIEDRIEIPIELSTYNFDVLCKTLKSFGFETITFTDLLNHLQFGRVLPQRSVIITSDDGFADLYTNAFDVLKKYDYKMTVFIVTDFIKENDKERVTNYFDSSRAVPMRPMLIWPEVKEMDQYGCEFLSHSANHIHLGLATDVKFKEELAKSKKDIEEHLKKPVLFFAWPYDNTDPAKIKLLTELGYVGAVRYGGGIETVSTLDLKEIKRVEFNSLIAPHTYTTYLELHSVSIDGRIKQPEVKKGEEFVLEYKIKNDDEWNLEITSMELELPDWVSLEGLEQKSYTTQYPGKKDGVFMWVSDKYIIEPGSQASMNLRLIANSSAKGAVKFRISAYNGYIEADPVQLEIN
ncbi:MAG: polysaccharide deacetylase family protein, partial [Actinobacteria bacterium]|nr:polysaccharide deacetylase family protein [Actinomycetota bacterium]